MTGNLKLTTAKFYSPTGREMEGQGVRPDVMVNGKTEDFQLAGLTRDQDVQTALGVMLQGTPAGLVANTATNRPAYDLSRLGNCPLSPNPYLETPEGHPAHCCRSPP